MKPLVSITIPTYNSEKTIEATLKSVADQDYPNIEIVIIDGYSKDNTLNIAKKFKARILMCKGGLLEARILGGMRSKGEYLVLIDSDQILDKTMVSRAVKLMDKHDALWLYERAFNKNKFLPSLYDADRVVTQEAYESNLAVVLPRFFKRKLMVKAWNNIPKKYIPLCSAQDHIVTCYEFGKISKKKIGRVDNAVFHMEPESIKRLIQKQYRWGRTTREFYKLNCYHEIMDNRKNFRKFQWNYPLLSIKSSFLRVLRGIPYKLGYWFG